VTDQPAPKPAKAPPFHSDPDDLADAMLDAGLTLDAIGLDRLAWSISAKYLLDGLLPIRRVRALPGWTPKRHAALVETGFWLEDPDGIRLAE
jgi:hypothetical protein